MMVRGHFMVWTVDDHLEKDDVMLREGFMLSKIDSARSTTLSESHLPKLIEPIMSCTEQPAIEISNGNYKCLVTTPYHKLLTWVVLRNNTTSIVNVHFLFKRSTDKREIDVTIIFANKILKISILLQMVQRRNL